MPVLRNARWERFAQILASPAPPTYADAYAQAGFNGDRAHAHRLSRHPFVRARIDELHTIAANILTNRLAKISETATGNNLATRESLAANAQAAFRIAEEDRKPGDMIQALKFLAEISGVSLKPQAPAAQHLHIHETLVDAPPRETLKQWTERKQQELEQRSTKQPIKLVATKTQQEEK